MKILKITLLSLLVVVIAGLFLLGYFVRKAIASPYHGDGEVKLIEIKSNESSEAVAAELKTQKIISSEKIFLLAAKFMKKKINPGWYEFAPDLTMVEVIKQIDQSRTKVIKLTFPEGWRIEQIGKRLSENGVLEYADFIEAAKGNEGKLFPDTFLFHPKMTGAQVVGMMREDFAMRTVNLSLTDEQLLLASIVEREAANDTDRALIAGIYQNRIDAKMALQSDPTVEYGRDTIAIAKLSESEQRNYTFWKSAKTAEYSSVKSAYNTYLSNNLPLAPICNPGIRSIEAAQNPLKTQYYYFLYGKDGVIHPSLTLAEHQALAVKYLY